MIAPPAPAMSGARRAGRHILRLVKGGPERRALDAGQLDAVLDPATGSAVLLPGAHLALMSARNGIENCLLAALPREDFRSLAGELEPVALARGQVLYQPGERIRHVWFPNDGQVSLLTVVVMARKALEVCLVGREGMIGIPLVLGSEVSAVRAVVQGAGSALRITAAAFRQALARSPALQLELHRYAYGKLLQARQAAACNRFHRVEARFARCLLEIHDRVRAAEFHLTHLDVAGTLGIRRVGVTNAAGALQRRKLIACRRGRIRILDRKGLEAAACECYAFLRTLAA